MKAHWNLHEKPEGAKRIKAAQNRALNLPVRRRRAADSANFASGRHMLMQVWRHQQEEQLPETPPQRIQTRVQQQQLGGKRMRYITTYETINFKRESNIQSQNVPSKGVKQKCKHIKRNNNRNCRKKWQKRFRKNKLNDGCQPFWFLNLRVIGERYQMQVL
ncbi:MAG: hypothetical protein EZS28_000224 [Streblomastix strix]|uniref:Uncharacterized protein n=1 Tax=Streblomastix strix TaxID=222440 RepID=A0A5J4XAL1_9EUKA|nr:MAG: hypothetical protein EZS28_000224 [Streblomastix strix]